MMCDLKILINSLILETLKNYQKLRFWFLSKILLAICRRKSKSCAHHWDFKFNEFLYAILNAKKQSL